MDENRNDLFGDLFADNKTESAEPLHVEPVKEELKPDFVQQIEETIEAVLREEPQELPAEPAVEQPQAEKAETQEPQTKTAEVAENSAMPQTQTPPAQSVQQQVNAFYNRPAAADNGCTYSYGRAQQPSVNQPAQQPYNNPAAQRPPVNQTPPYNRPPMYAQQPATPQYNAYNAPPAQRSAPASAQQTKADKKSKKKEKKEKKEKKQKSRISISQFLVCLLLCLVVSSVSGYFASKSAVKELFDEYAATLQTAGTTGSYNINIYEQPVDTTAPTTQPATQPSTEGATVPVINNASASDIYKQNVNAVVNITAKGTRTVNFGLFFGSQQQEFTSSGSGFFLTEDGYILTNYHVVENTHTITVTDYDGEEHSATLVGFEESNDIAVLKVSGTFQAVELGDSTTLEVGDTLLIIGNALGELQYTLTQGVVSYLERAVTTETGSVINMFQTDAAINSGNSGGPVFNAKGEVVGIASAKYASSSIEGLGFCIPIDDVKYMISDIVSYGYVTGKPSVGVSLYTNSSRTNGLPYGCYVVAVEYGSAADTAGLDEGDVITAVNGKSVRDVDDFGAALSGKQAGDSITLTVYDASYGYSSDVTLTLDEYVPADARTDYSNVYDF